MPSHFVTQVAVPKSENLDSVRSGLSAPSIVLKNVEYRAGSEVQVANVEQYTSIAIPGVLATWREGVISSPSRSKGGCVAQLDSVTSSRVETLDGREVVDFHLFKPLNGPSEGVRYSVCISEADVQRQLSLTIRNYLDGTTLTAFGNIMVKNGNFVALVD
ncbi:hypothetical protein F5X99DRAFT_410164 [Biscogniauxia marginata]|nr:hypothetical protein F5X99DRAFT_410164 [Biscogniauxia marginata]